MSIEIRYRSRAVRSVRQAETDITRRWHKQHICQELVSLLCPECILILVVQRQARVS